LSELDLRCSDVAQLATRYLEGLLPPPQQTSFETHLVYCESCVGFLDDIRNVAGRLRELPPDPVDPEERRAIVEAARQ
jgi:hypothetical protein